MRIHAILRHTEGLKNGNIQFLKPLQKINRNRSSAAINVSSASQAQLFSDTSFDDPTDDGDGQKLSQFSLRKFIEDLLLEFRPDPRHCKKYFRLRFNQVLRKELK